jgi:hypothetical protein
MDLIDTYRIFHPTVKNMHSSQEPTKLSSKQIILQSIKHVKKIEIASWILSENQYQEKLQKIFKCMDLNSLL